MQTVESTYIYFGSHKKKKMQNHHRSYAFNEQKYTNFQAEVSNQDRVGVFFSSPHFLFQQPHFYIAPAQFPIVLQNGNKDSSISCKLTFSHSIAVLCDVVLCSFFFVWMCVWMRIKLAHWKCTFNANDEREINLVDLMQMLPAILSLFPSLNSCKLYRAACLLFFFFFILFSHFQVFNFNYFSVIFFILYWISSHRLKLYVSPSSSFATHWKWCAFIPLKVVWLLIMHENWWWCR